MSEHRCRATNFSVDDQTADVLWPQRFGRHDVARFKRTLASREIDLDDGTELLDVQPLDESLYDRDEVGPMYAAETFDGQVYHLFGDEIQWGEPYLGEESDLDLDQDLDHLDDNLGS